MEENENNENEEIEAKAILLGDTGVGKTSLINVTTGKFFNENQLSTSSASLTQKTYNIDSIKYVINLWDTVGQEKFKSISKLFFKGSDIAILVYDTTNLETFKSLDFWVNALKENNSNSNCILGIVGNKCDKIDEQEVNEKEAENYAKSLGVKHKLVSAKADRYSFINFLEELVTDSRKYIFKKNGRIFLNIQKNKKNKCKC